VALLRTADAVELAQVFDADGGIRHEQMSDSRYLRRYDRRLIIGSN
jgi:hypothetical protein